MSGITPQKDGSHDDKVIMGRFGSPYGVRGWLRVISFTDPGGAIFNYSQWWTLNQTRGWQPVLVLEHRCLQGKQEKWVASLPDCHDPDQASHYTNQLIAVSRSALPSLGAEEYYWADLVGLRVITLENVELGYIDHLLETGANDVLVVNGEGRKRLLPYTDQVVKSIDLVDKVVRVDWDPEF